MNLNPSNFGANLSAEAGFGFAPSSRSLLSPSPWRENWKLELQLKLVDDAGDGDGDEEEAVIAVAEAAATEAARTPDFFIVGLDRIGFSRSWYRGEKVSCGAEKIRTAERKSARKSERKCATVKIIFNRSAFNQRNIDGSKLLQRIYISCPRISKDRTPNRPWLQLVSEQRKLITPYS